MPPSRRSNVATILSGAALLVALLNAFVLSYLVGGPQENLIMQWGLVLAVGPAVVFGAILFGVRWLALAAGVAYAVGSFITGFSVGFWNLIVGVPLSAIAIALAMERRPAIEK